MSITRPPIQTVPGPSYTLELHSLQILELDWKLTLRSTAASSKTRSAALLRATALRLPAFHWNSGLLSERGRLNRYEAFGSQPDCRGRVDGGKGE